MVEEKRERDYGRSVIVQNYERGNCRTILCFLHSLKRMANKTVGVLGESGSHSLF